MVVANDCQHKCSLRSAVGAGTAVRRVQVFDEVQVAIVLDQVNLA